MLTSSLRFIEPAQPTLADRPPPGTEWLHEVKFDGYRTQLAIGAGSARAYSRRGIDWTSRYPQIVAAAAALPCASAILDGEVILPNGAGGDFHRLASTIKRHPERLVFVAFDLLHLNGGDLAFRPVEERRGMLAALLQDAPPAITLSQAIEGDGEKAFDLAERLNLEGIISKRKGSPYRSGAKAGWVKAKTFELSTLEVVGFERKADDRPAALLARLDGSALHYAGRAVVSLKGRDRADFWRYVEQHQAERPSFIRGKVSGTWIAPTIPAVVKHLRGEESLRHASLIGFAERQ